MSLAGFHSDERLMGEALREARKALRAGEVPVGAVVVHGSRIVGRAHNQVETLSDATAHAEMLALTQAASALGDWRLGGCTLYVTKEPCAMCAGAMVQSRVDRVVYGAADPRSGAAGSALDLLRFPAFNHRCLTRRGVLGPECSSILKDFFRQRRSAHRE